MPVSHLRSYLSGHWVEGTGPEQVLRDAGTGEPVATLRSGGHDLGAALGFGRRVGGPALRALSFRARADLVSTLARALRAHRDEFLDLARTYGATLADARFDVDGGLGTLGYYGNVGRSLPDAPWLLDGAVEPLSRAGGFAGLHILVPREGVAVQINAYNFPCWGPLEKLGPALLAGVPTLIKPATRSALLTARLVERIVESGVLPEGAISLLAGSAGDLLDHLESQDAVLFTGSADTARRIRSHPRVISESVRVNVEADSLNAAVLGPDGVPGSAVRKAFLREIRRELAQKAGQKCTAIRRAFVPADGFDSVCDEAAALVRWLFPGDPRADDTRLGPLVDPAAHRACRDGLAALAEETEPVGGDPGEAGPAGTFFGPVVLRLRAGAEADAVHRVEVFGPVVTLLPYASGEDAAAGCRAGGGSLVTSVFSEDRDFLGRITAAIAAWNGRILAVSGRALAESTGHGTVMPQLLHGGPGRAGGGEELGGLRALPVFLNRCAVQGDPVALESLFPTPTKG